MMMVAMVMMMVISVFDGRQVVNPFYLLQNLQHYAAPVVHRLKIEEKNGAGVNEQRLVSIYFTTLLPSSRLIRYYKLGKKSFSE